MEQKLKKPLSLSVNSLLMAIILAFVGGFLDAYTYVTRDGVFATAQTGNTVLFAVRAASIEYGAAIQNIPPFLAFIAGVLTAEYIKDKHDMHIRAVLLLESSILFIVGLLSSNIPNMIVTMSIAFVSSLQIGTFNKLEKWSYNSTITTGNLRAASSAFYKAYIHHDAEAKRKFKGFGAIILFFILGALVGTYSSIHIGNKSIWLPAIIILLIGMLYHRRMRSSKVAKELENE